MDPLYQIKEGYRTCPYDPHHKVQALRFIAHLMKCAQRSTFKLEVCPWNATHHVYPDDYKKHLSSCESQELLDGIGEIAIPDSAFVREYKMQKLKEEEEAAEPVLRLTAVGTTMKMYYEPINTAHDYEVEVYNRRFLTQELHGRDIDEFDNPPVTGSSTYDLGGHLVDKGTVDGLPPGRDDGGDEDVGPRASGSSMFDILGNFVDERTVDGPPPGPDVGGDVYDDPDDSLHNDSGEEEPPGKAGSRASSAQHETAGFWENDPFHRVVDNHRFYYGRRTEYWRSDDGASDTASSVRFQDAEESGTEATDGDDRLSTTTDASSSGDAHPWIALDVFNRITKEFTCRRRTGAGGVLAPSLGSVRTQEQNHSYTIETEKRATSRPPTTLDGERPTYALEADSLQAKKENLSPPAVPQGVLAPSLGTITQEEKDSCTILSAGGETEKRASSRPPTTLDGERPTYALEADSLQARKENLSPPAVPQGCEGALKPKTATGFGRAYHLQKVYDAWKQGNGVLDAGEAPKPNPTEMGHGRGVRLRRQVAEFQLGKGAGKGETISTSGTWNDA